MESADTIVIKVGLTEALWADAEKQFGEYPVHHTRPCNKCGQPYGLHRILECPSLKREDND